MTDSTPLRLTGAALGLGACLVAVAGATPAAAQDRLVVLNREAAEAAIVDPESRDVLARLPTGPEPHEVALSPDGRLAYVANYAVPGGEDWQPFGPVEERRIRSTITVLDLESRTVLATFYPGEYRRLRGIRTAGSGKRLWLTAEADSGVVELDARSGAVLMLWKTGGAGSRHLAVSPDGRKLFIANHGSDSVSVIDRLTTVARRIPVGAGPEGIDIDRTGREVWVANRLDHTITVIDARKERPVATFPSGGRGPARLEFSPNGREVWVSNRGSRALAVFDRRTRELLTTLELDVEPLALEFSADGSRIYVSSPETNRVVVVEALERRVLHSFDPGDAPAALAWSRIVHTSATGR